MRVNRRIAIPIVVAILVVDAVILTTWLRRERDRSRAYDRLIAQIAPANGAPPYLVKAVIWRESRFDPAVRGKAGEIGLMQVTEGAATDWARGTGRKRFRTWMLWDARANIEAGSWYLGRALGRWRDRDDPIPFALAEYNAGPTHARRWAAQGGTAAEFLARIDYPGTRRYIDEITERARRYRNDFATPPHTR